MDIRLHIGAHRSATKHLRRMLEVNRDLLEDQGICLPEEEFAVQVFTKAVKAVRKGGKVDDINAELLFNLTGDREYRRIVLIDANISGSLLRPVGKEYFYPRIGNTIAQIYETLDGLPMRLFISLRNPATFIPSCYAEGIRHSNQITFEKFIEKTNLHNLRWSDFLHRAQTKKYDVAITAWRFEDYPHIWREVAQAITGIENKEALEGTIAPVNSGMSLRGAILMQKYLAEHSGKKIGDFDRVSRAFEQKFPSVEGETYNPTWPEDLTIGMTENYEDDWYYIERMEKVETIQPRMYS
ncbi:MAG: hypothetical protein GY952_14575 [Rhodobacteraceae bacterium]|nr:hypothetical protein [Paracoccaceae bacterium]